MRGRLQLRRPATVLVALVLAVVLVLLASMGSRVVPRAATAAVSPAATVVHLLGDEVVPAAPGPGIELRVRTLAPDDLALSVILATMLATIALASVLHRGNRMAFGWSSVSVHRAPGRSPPAARPHHR